MNRFNVSESIQRPGYESRVNLISRRRAARESRSRRHRHIFFCKDRAGFDGDRFNAVRLFRVISEDSAERDSLDESSALLMEGAQWAFLKNSETNLNEISTFQPGSPRSSSGWNVSRSDQDNQETNTITVKVFRARERNIRSAFLQPHSVFMVLILMQSDSSSCRRTKAWTTSEKCKWGIQPLAFIILFFSFHRNTGALRREKQGSL